MCNPALIAAAAVAGGTIYNRYDDANRMNKANDAAAASAREEYARQQGLADQARANVNSTLSDIADPSKRLDQAAQAREGKLGDVVSTIQSPYAMPRADAPQIVQQGFDAARGVANDHITTRNAASARVGALGDLIGENQRSIGDTEANNGVIGDNAGRSLSINALERDAAARNAGRRPALTLGDVLQIAGSIYGLGSGTLWGTAAGAGGAVNTGASHVASTPYTGRIT
jgi:hypothetical protein